MNMKWILTGAALIICLSACMMMQSDDTNAEVTASGTCGTDLNWTLEDGVLTISGSGTTMTDYTVLSSGPFSPWNEYKSSLSKIVIDAPNLTHIGKFAFYECSETTLEINSPITTIGESAFAANYYAVINELPDTITTIGGAAFSQCRNLALTKLPDNLTTMEYNVFYYTRIAISYLPSTLDSIGNGSFGACSKLPSTILAFCSPTTLATSIFGSSADYPVTTLINFGTSDWTNAIGKQSITVLTPTATGTCGTDLYWGYVESNTTLYIYGTGTTMDNYSAATIPWSAYITAITDIQCLANNLTNIGTQSFYGSESLTSITWPSKLATIGENAFTNSGLVSVTLPESVSSLGSASFASCTNLKSISLPDSLTTIKRMAFEGDSALKSIFLPNSITSIGDQAFSGCSNLALTSLPDGLTVIEAMTFYNCTNLALTSLPVGVTNIGSSAFKGCTTLALTSLPSEITTISSSAFQGCKGMTNLVIYCSPSSIDTTAFANCNVKEVLNLGTSDWSSVFPSTTTIKDHVDDVVMVQQKENVVHETVVKTDTASTLLRYIPVLMAIALMSALCLMIYTGSARRY